MTQKVQQLDLPWSNSKFYTLPKHLPGRVNTDDFVYFNYPSWMNGNDYVVAITTLDTSAGPLRTIGPLSQGNIEIPHIQLDPYGSIYVIPKNNPNLPRFYSRLNRASTYEIPDVSKTHRPGVVHEMRRHGMLTAGVDSSKHAY